MTQVSIHILVIDDNAEVLQIMHHTLEQSGFKVSTACNARDARELISKERLHLILVDLALPDGSGIEIVREVNTQDDPPSIIIITGNPSVDTAAEGMQLGTRNYLTKPISPDELLKAVQNVLTQDGILIETEEQLLSDLGRRLKSARQDADLTMKALGERVGISQAQISQIESGLSAPSLSTLFRLTRALHVSMSEIFAQH